MIRRLEFSLREHMQMLLIGTLAARQTLQSPFLLNPGELRKYHGYSFVVVLHELPREQALYIRLLWINPKPKSFYDPKPRSS